MADAARKDEEAEGVAFSVRLDDDGKRARIQLGEWAVLMSADEAFKLAITLQHIAARAKGNGG